MRIARILYYIFAIQIHEPCRKLNIEDDIYFNNLHGQNPEIRLPALKINNLSMLAEILFMYSIQLFQFLISISLQFTSSYYS